MALEATKEATTALWLVQECWLGGHAKRTWAGVGTTRAALSTRSAARRPSHVRESAMAHGAAFAPPPCGPSSGGTRAMQPLSPTRSSRVDRNNRRTRSSIRATATATDATACVEAGVGRGTGEGEGEGKKGEGGDEILTQEKGDRYGGKKVPKKPDVI